VAPTVAGAHAPSAAGSHTVARLLRNSYRLLGDMAPLLQNVEATAVRGFLEDATVPEAPYMAIEMGEYRILIEWTNVWKAHESRQPPGDPFIRGGGLIVQTGSSEFIIAGFGFRARFECIDAPDRVLEFLAIDEGDFLAGQWVPGRRLNGDEYRIDLSLGTAGLPQIRRIAPYSYPVAPG